MPRSPALAILLLAALAGGPLAGQDHSYDGDGSGTLQTGSGAARQEVGRVEAMLYDNGGIDLTLSARSQRWIFRGTWYGNPASGSVGFRLDSGFELPADGSGRLYLRRDQLDRVDFHGSNRDGAFEFSFAGGGSGGPRGEPALDLTRGGDGDLDLGDDGDRLERVRVTLDEDGRAELRLWGATRYTLTGRWTGTLASGRVRLTVTAWGRDEANLSGTLNTSRRTGWDRLALDGTAAGRSARVRFGGLGDALDNGNDDANDPGVAPVKALDRTMRGEGRLRLGNAPETALRVARVNLRDHGKADFYLEGDGPRLVLRGSWSQRDNAPRIDLKIRDGLGQNGTEGSGSLSIPDGERWERLTLSGRTASGSWTIDFRGDGPGHLGPGGSELGPMHDPIRELGVTVTGSGKFTWPGVAEPTAVTEVRLQLGTDKKAVVDIAGARTGHFTGRWATTDNPNRVGLALTGGSIEGLIASGVVTLDEKRAVVAVSIDGRQFRRPVKMVFQATPAMAVPPARN